MSHFEFILPLNLKDLEVSQTNNQYVVGDILYISDVPDKVLECKQLLKTEGADFILEGFDVLYSVICHFSKLNQDIKEAAWQIILGAAAKLNGQLCLLMDDAERFDSDVRMKHLNLLKMVTYILCQLMEAFESEQTKPSQAVVISGKGRKKQSKKKDDAHWDWSSEIDNAIQCLHNLFQFPIKRLWDPPVIEEDFLNLVTGCCFKLLENPDIVRNKTVKDNIFNFLGLALKNYSTSLGYSLKIIQLLQHFDHLVIPLAQAVQLFVCEYGGKNIVCEIMREIGRLDVRDLCNDSSGTKAISQFLVELSDKLPSAVLSSVSLLIPYLDEDAYTMRNCVLSIMGEIIIKILSREDLESKEKEVRDQMMDKLEEHIHDVTAFVRSKVLQIWHQLCIEKAIPLSRQYKLLQLIIDRLQDKSSLVRKNAIQFITAFLQGNPYAAQLSLEELRGNYEKEKAKLKDMMPDSQGNNDNELIINQWTNIENDLLELIQEVINDDCSDITFDEDMLISQAFSKLIMLLKNSELKHAVKFLKVSMQHWPDHEMFLKSDTQDCEDPLEKCKENSSQDEHHLLHILKLIYLGSLESCSELSKEDDSNKMEDAVENNLNEAVPEKNSYEDCEVNELSKQQILVHYLQDTVKFAEQIQAALPLICQLLYSKTISDVLEAIDFFVAAFEFGVRDSFLGVRHMLLLIWSQESSVKDAVVSAYKRLYLKSEKANNRMDALQAVQKLLTLVHGAKVGELASVDGLIAEFVKSGDLDESHIQVLWEKFTMKLPNTTAEESRAALVLLGMTAGSEPEIVKKNMSVLSSVGLGPRADKDFELVRDTCTALLKIGKKPSVEDKDSPYRLHNSHEIFERLAKIIVNGLCNLENRFWVPMAEQAIRVIYKLAENPDTICETIVKQLVNNVMNTALSKENKESKTELICESAVLTRLLSLIGHVALCQLFHLEVNIFTELKRRQGLQEKKEERKKKHSFARPSVTPRNRDHTTDTTEDELGLTGAVADDTEAEYICKICDMQLLNAQNLLGQMCSLVMVICSNPTEYKHPDLRAAASLALAKLMIVSSTFSETHLQLLITILEKSTTPAIRANTIIALGDLAIRFPNLLDPWTPHLYGRLRDPSVHVRKNTLTVLTHLILHDMIRVKGQISDMALCIMDDDKSISDMAKMFFHELAKKSNSIYNILPDIISHLSDPEGGVNKGNFRIILRYLFQFIEKDRQVESLVEKICHRFPATRSEEQWQDLSFCLSLLTYNERSLHKLQEQLPCYADKLSDPEVYELFTTILNTAKKAVNLKPETKALIEEIESKFEEIHSKGLSEVEIAQKASTAVPKTKQNNKRPNRRKELRSETSGTTRKGRRKRVESCDSESDFEDSVTTSVRRSSRRQHIAEPSTIRSSRSKTVAGKKRPPVYTFSSDSDAG